MTVIAAIVTTIVLALVIGKRLGMPRAQRVLSGGAVAICGRLCGAGDLGGAAA